MSAAAPVIDRDRLVIDHLPLARRIAYSRPLPAHVDRDDTIAAAQLGLVQAAAKWDGRPGVSFGHFASSRILGAITDMQRADDPLSRRDRRVARNVEKARQRFTSRERRPPSDIELAGEAGVEESEMRATLAAVEQAVPLHLEMRRVSLAWADEQTDAVMCVPDPDAERPFDAVLDRPALRAALATLSAREQYIMGRRFVEDAAQAQIGEELGVSESRISQIETRARHRLRVLLAAAEAA